MKDFIYIKCCAKGFFSEISILGDKWLLKNAPNNEKLRFTLHWVGIEKVLEFIPPLLFNFR